MAKHDPNLMCLIAYRKKLQDRANDLAWHRQFDDADKLDCEVREITRRIENGETLQPLF